MDFRKLLSPKSRAEIAERRAQVLAFQTLSPLEMAEELMTHVRSLRGSGQFSNDPHYSYDEAALYRVAPELARVLDPDFELDEAEHPAPEEARDKVTYLRGQGPDKLRSFVASILAHGSFERAQRAGRYSEIARKADLAFGRCPSLFSIAADTAFPGIAPVREAPEERAPLPGFQVIASFDSGYDKSLHYTEDRDLAERSLDVAEAYFGSSEVDDGDLDHLEKMRLRFDTTTPARVSLQTYEGAILDERVIAAEPEVLEEPGA